MDMKKVGPQPLDAAVANRLLDLLSTDDAFRELFVRDARAALETAGYVNDDPTAAHPAMCLQVHALASKESIAASRSKLTSSLNAIHGFDAPRELKG